MIVQFVIATWMGAPLPLMDFHSVSKTLGSAFVVMVPLEASVKDAWLVINLHGSVVSNLTLPFARRMGFMTSEQVASPVNVIRVALLAKSVIKTLQMLSVLAYLMLSPLPVACQLWATTLKLWMNSSLKQKKQL